MYTKVFRSIYDGTLADNWKALVTFQQFLILCDESGVVDMTLSAMSRTTGIPLEILQEGVEHLESADPMSRTPDMEGRRIARLDEHRTWGWFLVNFKKYKDLRHREEKKEADRVRISAKRSEAKATTCDNTRQDATGSDASQIVANVAHTDTDTDKDTDKSITPIGVVSIADEKQSRLAEVTQQAIDAFNATLSIQSGGLLSAVTLCSDKRKAQVKRTLKLASQACERLYGAKTVTPEFWKQYFEEVAQDPFKSGKGPYHKPHENWRPDFEYLTRPEVVEAVIDDAMSRSAAA